MDAYRLFALYPAHRLLRPRLPALPPAPPLPQLPPFPLTPQLPSPTQLIQNAKGDGYQGVRP